MIQLVNLINLYNDVERLDISIPTDSLQSYQIYKKIHGGSNVNKMSSFGTRRVENYNI